MGKRRIERKEIIPAKKRRVVTITDKTISKRIPTRAPRMATLFLTEPASPLREGGATRDRFWSVTNNRKNGGSKESQGRCSGTIGCTYNCSPGWMASGFSKSMVAGMRSHFLQTPFIDSLFFRENGVDRSPPARSLAHTSSRAATTDIHPIQHKLLLLQMIPRSKQQKSREKVQSLCPHKLELFLASTMLLTIGFH